MDWPAIIALMIPVLALMIPIVAIFVHHQQKMAQILHQNPVNNPEVSALRQEIAELKTLVHQQAITLDNIATAQRSLNEPPAVPSLTDRLGTNG